MEGMCCTHRDDPVANMQCAVSVCCSPVCNARDVDSLKQILSKVEVFGTSVDKSLFLRPFYTERTFILNIVQLKMVIISSLLFSLACLSN